jgi:hypothetical protein
MTKKILPLLLPLFLTSCLSTSRILTPHLDFSVQDKYIKSLPLSFTPLSSEEKKEMWGHEAYLGHLFAQNLELYPAISALKRAHLLVPKENKARKEEIEYGILYCYYLGKKYQDVTDTFEETSLQNVDSSFPLFKDLLTVVSECYIKNKELDRAAFTLQTLHKFHPDHTKKLLYSLALSKGDLDSIEILLAKEEPKKELLLLTDSESEEEYRISKIDLKEETSSRLPLLEEAMALENKLQAFTTHFKKTRKSPATAACLNLIPGLGYLYLGQKQSAFTAFCLNSLFIGASYYFYRADNIPAAVITTGFEMGWYFAGIVGAKEATILYNERLYESQAHPLMRENKLYPLLQLNYGF